MSDGHIASAFFSSTSTSRRSHSLPLCIAHIGTVMSSCVYLPRELEWHILRNVEGDGHTTYLCMRVCAEWYEILVDSLYKPPRLHSRAQLDRLVYAVRTYPAVRARLALSRTVAFSRPALGFEDALSLVLRTRIRCIEHFSFQNCLLGSLPQTFFDLFPWLVSVTRLSLTTFDVGSFAKFRRIICAFPLLRELDLTESRVPADRLYVRHLPTGPPARSIPKLILLRVNNLEASFFHNFVAWMCSPSAAACTNIETLDVSQDFRDDSDAPPVGMLLDNCASSVRHVHLRNTGFGM